MGTTAEPPGPARGARSMAAHLTPRPNTSLNATAGTVVSQTLKGPGRVVGTALRLSGSPVPPPVGSSGRA